MMTETYAEIGIPVNPFPGLRPFEFDESHLFFGREGQSESLIDKLSRTHFLAVVGTSGSGKSSLVRAGLLPALMGGFMTSAGSNWRIAIMRPGNDPVGNLARALNAPEVFGSEIAENAALQTALAEATLRRGCRGLVDAVRQAVVPENENLLVVVDQFEEIFRFARIAQGEQYQNEAAAFVKLLLEASLQREIPIFVVLTMRSDYLGDCSEFWGLPEAINESQYLIPRLTRDQLREAISGPVAVGGGKITSRLVNRLLNDVGDNQDQLPVLQHLLMRVWDESKEKQLEVEVKEADATVRKPHREVHDGEAIDLCCYEAVGGMAEALSRHADEAFNDLPDERSREVAEMLFKGLTEKGLDNREIRRPTAMGEICSIAGATAPEVITIIETFRTTGRSFLMPPPAVTLDENSLIDISHESLIRRWGRLREWVDEEARSARTYQRLADTTALYRKGEEGVLRDPGLQLALDWQAQNRPNEAWARRYDPNFEAAMAFLEESRFARETEAHEKQAQRKKAIKRARLLAVVFGVLFMLALGAGIIAWSEAAQARSALSEVQRQSAEATTQKNNALRERNKANLSAEEAKKAEDVALLEKQRAEDRKKEADVATKVAEEQKSIAQKQGQIANEQRKRAEEAAAQASLGAEEANQERQRAEEALAVVKSQDHAPPFIKAVMRGSQGVIVDAAFTDQGKVVTAGFDSKARVWDLNTEAEVDTLQDEGMGNVLSAMLSSDGDRAVTVSDDPVSTKKETEKVVRIWYRSAARVLSHTVSDSTPKAFFILGDKDLVTWNDKSLELLSVATRERMPLPGLASRAPADKILDVIFARSGLWLVVITDDKNQANKSVRLLNALDRHEIPFSVEDEVSNATISADATLVLTLNTNKTACLWNAITGKKLSTLKGHGQFKRAIFSPNNSRVLTVGEDKLAELWDVTKDPAGEIALQGGPDRVLSEAFSPDGKYVVTASLDNSAIVWDTDDGAFLRELRGHTSPVTSVSFSSDSQYVVTAGDKTARVWEAAIGFDFVKRAPKAEWVTGDQKNESTTVGFNGSEADAKGFVLWREGLRLEDGSVPSGQVLETHPKWVDDGRIAGLFPPYLVQPGDHFKANFGFLLGGQLGSVAIQLTYKEEGKPAVLVKEWKKAYDGKLLPLDADLSGLAGHRVRFALVVLANGTSAQDWATWVSPRIVQK